MNSFITKRSFLPPIYTLLALLLVAGLRVSAQNCSCAGNECCSKYGYCGTTKAYCGPGCQEGPCTTTQKINGVEVDKIVTDSFFNGLTKQAADNCTGKKFYTRCAFLDTLKSYPKFGRVGSVNDSKREIAAFFGHVTHETGQFCYIEEIGGKSQDYCDEHNEQYPCAQNKSYYGRGPIQLSWNYNYGAAGIKLGKDLLNYPELVATNATISFETALWYWMLYCHDDIISGEGFGATIRAINGGECDGGNKAAVANRVKYYKSYCKLLGVNPGPNLSC